MFKKLILIFYFFNFLFFVNSCNYKDNNSLLVFCGTVVKEPITKIAEKFTKKTAIKVDLIFAGSGSLISQISLTKKGDIFISGSNDFMQVALKKNLVEKNSIKNILKLNLALCVTKNNTTIKTLKDLINSKAKIGVANENVCLGLYTKKLLQNLTKTKQQNIAKKIKDNIKVETKSCEDTALLLLLNKVEVIFGWDIFQSLYPHKIKCFNLNNTNNLNTYVQIAKIKFSTQKENAAKFIKYIFSSKGIKNN